LRPAALAWSTPADLQAGQSKQVELRITLDPERMAMLADRIRAGGVTTTAHAEFAPVVIATLSSTEFEVSPPGPQRQQIMQGRDAVWAWAIRAKSAGTHPLILHVESELPEANVKDPFVREIHVRALQVPMATQAMDFAMRNWDKLLTLVLLPLGAWALKRWRDRRRPGAVAA
jgi:isopentenyl diphosphate isomerase/L-lactate dehydrogenase-like FMN-dependent dehydrogenase